MDNTTWEPGPPVFSMAWEIECAEADAAMAQWVEDRLRERMLAGESGFDEVTRARLLRG